MFQIKRPSEDDPCLSMLHNMEHARAAGDDAWIVSDAAACYLVGALAAVRAPPRNGLTDDLSPRLRASRLPVPDHGKYM